MPQIFPMDDDLDDLSKEREILQKLVKAHPPLMFGFLRPLSSDEKRVVNPIAKKVFKAAFVGNHSGEALLGLMFSKGWGMKRDRRMAVHWNRKSATGGDLDGQYQLGMNYLEGRGVRRDRDEASKYFFDAAHAGHPAAKNELGRMYNIPAWT